MFEDNYLEEVTIDDLTYHRGSVVTYDKIGWSSDWNGYEVGYEDIPVVGLYSFLGTEIYLYLNTEDSTILEMWESGEEE